MKRMITEGQMAHAEDGKTLSGTGHQIRSGKWRGDQPRISESGSFLEKRV